MQHSTGYILMFAAAVCGVCSIFVSGAAVMLEPRQLENQLLDRQKQVLTVAGLTEPGQTLTREEISKLFADSVHAEVVSLKTGAVLEGIDSSKFDQQKASVDSDTSTPAPDNPAKVRRLPHNGLVYRVIIDGRLQAVIVPISGYGLWGTLYGYIALAPDIQTIRGITFYKHKETPGLGGEVDNPNWKALWVGRKAFDKKWEPVVNVIKGRAGSAEEDPYQIDGLSGATITSRGVGHLVRFWLGENGFGPYLKSIRPGGTG